MKLELWYPIKPFILTQDFGNKHPLYTSLGLAGHNGLDIMANDGDSVRAAHDGTVTFSGEDGAGGLTIVIRTNEPKDYLIGESYFKTIYCHLKKGSIKVRATDKVSAGDLLALADNTGISSGSHLHFGLKPIVQGEADWVWENVEQQNGYRGAIDPTPYFNGYYAQDTQAVVSILQGIINLLKKAIYG